MKNASSLVAAIRNNMQKTTERATMSLCVISGKGGVGKTNITLNIAYALQEKCSSLLIDCDMGLANLDVLLGIAPEKTMQDALLGNCQMDDVLYKHESGLHILPAASGMPDLVELDKEQRKLLLKRINPMLNNYDYVLLDIGAGITNMVQAFARMAALPIVVITPEPTSLVDSYALIKILYNNHKMRDFMIIVNQVTSPKEEKQSFGTLANACQNFLGIKPSLLGSIRYDPKLIEAVRKQKALLSYAKDSPASLDIIKIAKKIKKVQSVIHTTLIKRKVLQMPT